MSKDDNYTNVILEDVNSKFEVIVEAVGQIQDQLKESARQTDLEEVKADVKTIKAVVTEQNSQMQDHDQPISTLEDAKP